MHTISGLHVTHMAARWSMMLMFVVNLYPKADQPHQEDRCWSQCLLTEQWCLLAHLHYKVDLYLIIRIYVRIVLVCIKYYNIIATV